MMWLVDFKLDFLNDIEKNGGNIELNFPLKVSKFHIYILPEKRTQDYESVEQNKRIKLSEVQDSCLALDDNDSPLNLSHLGHPPATLLTSTVTPASTVTETGGSKPNYTYTDLITLALRDKTSLTVSGIYQWITDNFPYYKAEDDRWKNSVRHNLSMNPNFRKGGRAKQGTGHVWVLADQNDLNRQVNHKSFLLTRIELKLCCLCRKLCQSRAKKTQLMRPLGRYYSQVFLKPVAALHQCRQAKSREKLLVAVTQNPATKFLLNNNNNNNRLLNNSL